MKAHLLVFATSVCLAAAFATPAFAASTTTNSHTAKAAAPNIVCNLKGCRVIHKKAQHKTGANTSSSSNSVRHNGAPPHL